MCVSVGVCNCMCGDTGPFSGHKNRVFTSFTQEIRDDEPEIVTHPPNIHSFFFQCFVLSIAFINVILHMSSPSPWLLSASLPPSDTLLIEHIYSLVGKLGQWFWAKHMLGTEDAEMKEAGPLQQGTHILGRDLYRYWQSFANSLVETGRDSLLKHRGERSSHWKVPTHSESSSSSAPYSRMPSCPEMWGFRCIIQPLPPTTLPPLLYHTQT